MIEWLTDWLTQIIIVVLLAVFVDLILPGSSMHRYVKLVMGLFILMTMLSPILSIISKDFSIQETLADMVDNPEMEGTQREAFERQAERLKVFQQNQSRDYMSQYIRSRIKEQIETSYPVQVENVEVETDLQTSDHRPEGVLIPQIKKVSILLKESVANSEEKENSRNGESVRTVMPVEPIEPIVIEEIRIGMDEKEKNEQAAGQKRKDAKDAYSGNNYIRWERAIEDEIRQWWQLESVQIEIRWMTG